MQWISTMRDMRKSGPRDGKRIFMLKAGAITFACLMILVWFVILFIEQRSGPVSPVFYLTLVPLFFIVAFLLIFVRRQEKAIMSGKQADDERISAIDNKAGRHTVAIMIWFLLASAFYQLFMDQLGLPDMPLRYYIWLTFFLMIGIFAGFRWYFGRKEL